MAAAKKSTSMGIAYEKIMQKIMAEQLLPGTPLREERLAEEFG
ncbi:MAG: GntR family transcriptional regulator, partial [Lentisphaeria bacterium]|nr:GntR family transcriptional regulator [Lentisphaeria bacterium]